MRPSGRVGAHAHRASARAKGRHAGKEKAQAQAGSEEKETGAAWEKGRAEVRPLMARPRQFAQRGAPRREEPTPSRILGVFRAGANENRIEPTDRRARAEWVVPRGSVP